MEHVEHPREDIGRESHPRIADAHDSCAGVLFGGEPDVPARRREFHSVVEHIGKHLHEPRAVAVDTNRRRGQLYLHRVPRCRGECRDRFDGGGHQLREVERFTAQLDFVDRDTGDVQEVVDESHELPDLTLDHLSSVFRERASAVNFQDLQREPYRCQRVRSSCASIARNSSLR